MTSASSTSVPPQKGSGHLDTLLLVGFSLLLYIATTGFEFVSDDESLILENPYVRSFHFLKEIFSGSFWSFQGTYERHVIFYRPLVMLTLVFERAVFGYRPAGFHLLNVILNSFIVLLVYRVGRRFWPEGRGAFWAAFLFAALPVHVENVAPVSGLSDLECALFFLAATYVYVHPPGPDDRLPRIREWCVATFFLLAVLSKEVALVLPILLFFYEHCVRSDGRVRWIKQASRYAPTLLVAAVYLVLRLKLFGTFAGPPARPGVGVRMGVISGLDLFGEYVFKLVWPQHLTYFEQFHPPASWLELYVLLGFASILLGFAGFVRLWRRDRAAGFVILWFLLTLAPVLDVRWLWPSAYGERYLYIPSVGFCWLAGEGLARLGRFQGGGKVLSWIARALPLLLIGLATARTAIRLPEWKNNFALAAATLREAPDAAPYHVILGNGYRLQGRLIEAQQAYMAAIAYDPLQSEAYINLAGILADEGAVDGARGVLERAVAANPFIPEVYYAWGAIEMGADQRARAQSLFERAVEVNPNFSAALNNLGVLFLEEGKTLAARIALERAVRADPDYGDAHNNLGSAYARDGDFGRAEAEFRRAIELSPLSEHPYLNLAQLYEDRQNPRAALDVYRATVRALPNSANAHFRLGVAATKLGDYEQAVQALKRAAELGPDSPLAHTQLGLAYLKQGNRNDARREFETALHLNPKDATATAALREIR